VNAQLVDGKDGLEQWSQSFDRPFGDVLQIQSDIAAHVARALSVELGSTTGGVVSIGGTNNPKAQDLLLQATATEGDDSSGALLRRIGLLGEAIRADPNYAEAYARKALQQELWSSAYAASADEKDRGEADALQLAKRSIALAPSLALGHTTLGFIYHNRLAMKPSLVALQRAAELPGAETIAFSNYALALVQMQRQREAQSVIDRAISLDPFNAVARMMRAYVLFYSRRYAESIDAARAALAIAPGNLRARGFVAWSLFLLNRQKEAAAEGAKMPADDYRRLVVEGAIAARSNRKDEALAAIQKIRDRYGDAAYYQQAQVYAQLGLLDESAKALQIAWSKRDPGVASMQVDPFLDPLRRDPRYLDVANRVFG
jgi:cytochrome c-type biogenesis protein CcmH/NrfG